MNTFRVKITVSIAGTYAGQDFSYQPGDVVDLERDLAVKWVLVGHAERVDDDTPTTERDLDLRDLDIEEALTRPCTHCSRRARFVFQNRPFCAGHYRAEMESR